MCRFPHHIHPINPIQNNSPSKQLTQNELIQYVQELRNKKLLNNKPVGLQQLKVMGDQTNKIFLEIAEERRLFQEKKLIEEKKIDEERKLLDKLKKNLINEKKNIKEQKILLEETIENKKREEERQKYLEKKKIKAEKKIAEEQKRIAEEKKRIDEKKRLEEEKNKLEINIKLLAEEKKNLEIEKKKIQEMKKIENEKKKLADEVKKISQRNNNTPQIPSSKLPTTIKKQSQRPIEPPQKTIIISRGTTSKNIHSQFLVSGQITYLDLDLLSKDLAWCQACDIHKIQTQLKTSPQTILKYINDGYSLPFLTEFFKKFIFNNDNSYYVLEGAFLDQPNNYQNIFEICQKYNVRLWVSDNKK